ncbi:cytochrome c oxidase subunit 2A [Neobacillus drentensis]
MGASQRNNQKESVEVHEKPLKGTWISVGVVGAVILATYLLLYGLYMTRV